MFNAKMHVLPVSRNLRQRVKTSLKWEAKGLTDGLGTGELVRVSDQITVSR